MASDVLESEERSETTQNPNLANLVSVHSSCPVHLGPVQASGKCGHHSGQSLGTPPSFRPCGTALPQQPSHEPLIRTAPQVALNGTKLIGESGTAAVVSALAAHGSSDQDVSTAHVLCPIAMPGGHASPLQLPCSFHTCCRHH
jgi:hypothetical protein